MKPTALLAVAIFLVCAPSPDSKTISELSYGFLSDTKVEPLLADDSNSVQPMLPVLEISAKDTELDNS